MDFDLRGRERLDIRRKEGRKEGRKVEVDDKE